MSTKSRWEISQELERKYNESSKPKAWGVPYSFNYWADHIDLVDFEGINLEVGCGQDGFWRFSDQIIGTDSLDFSQFGKNFIQANVEHLPFEDNHFRDCYSMNMVDHTENPQKAVNEMVRVTSHRVYIICNAFSWYMKPIMNKFDTIHPYHFTDNDIINLVPDTAQITKSKRKDFIDMEVKTAQFLPKMKLLLAQGLGTHRLLIHIDKK
jgi:SAM-dependent methyltransferase